VCDTTCLALSLGHSRVFQSSESFPRRGEGPGENFAPTVGSVPLMAAPMGVVSILGGIIVELAFSSDEYGLVS
jgi:hypothetical protein